MVGKRTCVAAISRSSARPVGSRSSSSGGSSRSQSRSSAVRTGGVGGGALAGQEDAEHRGFQLRGALQVGDAVVRQRLAQRGLERLRQAGALHVQALQVGVEVLVRAVQVALAGALLGGRRAVAAQVGQVGEDLDQAQLAGQRAQAVLDGGGAGGEVVRQDAVLVVRVDVEAQQQAAKVLLALRHAGADRDLGGGGGQVQLDGLGRLRGRGGRVGVLLDDLLQAQQRGAGLHLAADGDRRVPSGGP